MAYHGFEAFTIQALESYKNITPYDLAAREMAVIKELNPHYNLSIGGKIGRGKK